MTKITDFLLEAKPYILGWIKDYVAGPNGGSSGGASLPVDSAGYLKNDGTGGLSWAQIISGGSGTVNRLAYFDTGATIDSADHLTVGAGSLVVQPAINNAETFAVKDVAGTSYFLVDTLNGYAGYTDPGGYINLGTNDASIFAYNSTATRAGLSVQSDNNGTGQYNYHTLLATTTAAGSGRYGTLGLSLGGDAKSQIRWEQNSNYSEANADGSLAIWTRKTNMERAATFIGVNGHTLLNITRGSTLVGYSLGTVPAYKLQVNGDVGASNYISAVATGTQPYACTSETLNTNLNSDLLDGYHAAAFLLSGAGLKLASTTKSADYTATPTDCIIEFTAAATLTLPAAASNNGQVYLVYAAVDNVIIDDINGVNFTMNENEWLLIWSNGSVWRA